MRVVFFFQAEDGIRAADVTGVQTCALPICVRAMIRRWHRLLVAMLLAIPAIVVAQSGVKPQGHGEGLDPAELLRPLSESWPTYSGDYSGRRYSALTQINQSNVK